MAQLPAPEGRTKPRPRFPQGVETDSNVLAHKRYGTYEMSNIFGAERTFEYILRVQATSAQVLSDLYPDVVPREDARVLVETANLQTINPARIRELEAKTGHDIIAINTAWEEVVKPISPTAASHINKIKTSADSTEPAKALQLKDALTVFAGSVENLRDIALERALEWSDVPHMDTTHLYDAVPTVAGRPFAHYAELLQSGLDFLKFVYDTSLFGKWSDVTGNYHSATDLGIDGREIEEALCYALGIWHMRAAAQVPGREYLMDSIYVLERIGETADNLAHFIRMGRSDDMGIFKFPPGKKGSSGMPHKDAKGGNPTAEEQTESMARKLRGVMTTQASTCQMDYARDLSGSASDRMDLEDAFMFSDHAIRNLADVVYKLILVPERCKERVNRSYGVVTSPRILAYLTDTRNPNAMPRSEAHDLLGKLATEAHAGKKPFAEVLLGNEAIRSRMSEDEIRHYANPENYIGKSREIINAVYEVFHGKTTIA